MDGERDSPAEEWKELLDWWAESGVDAAIAEAPRNWLKPAPAVLAPANPASNLALPTHQTLGELQGWLSDSAQLPLASASAKRILPHGPAEAAVMLLSDSPALEDLASGQPIGGEAWALMVKMLAAIGLGPDQAYSASLSCFAPATGRMSDKDRSECVELARKHVALAAPLRLLLLGDGPCRALLGKPLAAARGHVHKIEGVRTVATFHPRWLLERPGDKARAWADLLLLTEDQL